MTKRLIVALTLLSSTVLAEGRHGWRCSRSESADKLHIREANDRLYTLDVSQSFDNVANPRNDWGSYSAQTMLLIEATKAQETWADRSFYPLSDVRGAAGYTLIHGESFILEIYPSRTKVHDGALSLAIEDLAPSVGPVAIHALPVTCHEYLILDIDQPYLSAI